MQPTLTASVCFALLQYMLYQHEGKAILMMGELAPLENGLLLVGKDPSYSISPKQFPYMLRFSRHSAL